MLLKVPAMQKRRFVDFSVPIAVGMPGMVCPFMCKVR